MNHLVLKCSTNDSSCPCIKCIKNEEAGGKLLNEVQVFHLMMKLLNIQVFTMKRGIGTATSESEGGFQKENLVKKKMVFGVQPAILVTLWESLTISVPPVKDRNIFFFFCEIWLDLLLRWGLWSAASRSIHIKQRCSASRRQGGGWVLGSTSDRCL